MIKRPESARILRNLLTVLALLAVTLASCNPTRCRSQPRFPSVYGDGHSGATPGYAHAGPWAASVGCRVSQYHR